MRKSILLFLILLLSYPCYGADIYVDNSSSGCSSPSDTDYTPGDKTCGSGSETVWDTIDGGLEDVNGAGGDTVHIRAGTYNEYSNWSKAITSSGPWTIIQPYSTETVNWSGVGNNICLNTSSSVDKNYIKIQAGNGTFNIYGTDWSTFENRAALSLGGDTGSAFDNFIIDGINFDGSISEIGDFAIVATSIEYLEIKNCTFNTIGLGGVYINCCDYVYFHDNLIYNTGLAQATASATFKCTASTNHDDLRVINNTVYDSTKGCLTMQNYDGFIFKDNLVYNCEAPGIQTEATTANYGSNGIIIDNTAYNCGSGCWSGGEPGIWVDQTESVYVVGNRLYNNLIGLHVSDAPDKNPSTIAINNLIYANDLCGETVRKSAGILISAGAGKSTDYAMIAHNTVYESGYDASGDGFGSLMMTATGANSSENHLIINNILMNGEEYDLFHNADVGTTNILDYDCWYNSSDTLAMQWLGVNHNTSWSEWKDASGQEASGLNVDPKFDDAPSGTFSLQSDSECIDAGRDLTEVTTDVSAECTDGSSVYVFVDDARWFYTPDGMGITNASYYRLSILVGTDICVILDIDYANDKITCVDAIVCADNEGVNYAYDYAGNSRVVGGVPDIGAYEYQVEMGWEWGKTEGEHVDGYVKEGWTDDGWSGDGTIEDGDEEGNLAMDDDEYFYGPVKDKGDTELRGLTITSTNITGSGTICLRGQASTFTDNAVDPDWEAYSIPIDRSWRYIQIGVVNGVNCTPLP